MSTNDEFHRDSPPHIEKKLYKSANDRIIDGVCGGVGKFFNINPIWVRILWVVFTFYTGVFPGIVAYIAAVLIIPRNPNEAVYEKGLNEHLDSVRHMSNSLVTIIGSALIIIGLFYLFSNFNLIPWEFLNLARYFVRQALFPIILIGIGLLLIFKRGRNRGE